MFFLTMIQHTNMVRRFCVPFAVGGKENYGKTYEFFKEKQQQELYHSGNSSPPLQTFSQNMGQIFTFSF